MVRIQAIRSVATNQTETAKKKPRAQSQQMVERPRSNEWSRVAELDGLVMRTSNFASIRAQYLIADTPQALGQFLVRDVIRNIHQNQLFLKWSPELLRFLPQLRLFLLDNFPDLGVVSILKVPSRDASNTLAITFSRWIEEFPWLLSITVKDCFVDDTGACALIGAIQNRGRFFTLDLSENCISDHCVGRIRQQASYPGFRSCGLKLIQNLRLDQNGSRPEKIRAFLRGCGALVRALFNYVPRVRPAV